MGTAVVVSHIDHIADVALRACKLGGFLSLDVNYEEEVVPQAVFLFDVFFKGHLFILKLASFHACSNSNSTEIIVEPL